MRRRILAAILGITAMSILLFGVPLAVVAERFVDQDAMLRLERQAILAARDVPADYRSSNDPVELPGGADSALLALYDDTGNLVAGDGPRGADATTGAALANRVSDAESNGLRTVAVPVTADEQVIGAIRAEQPTSTSDARTWRNTGLLAGLACAVFAVGATLAVVVARRLARPVRRLTDATVALGAGAFDVTVARSGIEELDAAGDALAATARRLDSAIRRERAFSSDASHQLRTPLAGLRAAIEAELEFPRPDSTTVLREALEDVERLERTTGELLSIARAQQAPDSSVDLTAELSTVREMWHGRFAAVGRPLRFDVAGVLPPILGNAVLLRHALDVLLDNALVHGAGTVTVSASVTPATVAVSIGDEGAGFGDPSPSPAAAAPRGLGLELARRLLSDMGARLVIVRRRPRPVVEVVMARVGPGLTPGPTSA